jgi:hypothetical protein
VVGSGSAVEVHILPQLDRALGSEDDEAAVAPGRKAVGREPVDPDRAASAIAFEDDVAEILEAGQVGMADIADGARDDPRGPRSGEVKELIDLMGGDVVEDAAVGRPVEEPVRPDGPVQPMRPEPGRVNDAA